MNSRFRLKLALTMVLFALAISVASAILDHIRLKEEIVRNNQFQVKQIEDSINYSLQTLEKAYYFLDKDTTSRMEANTNYLVELYNENPHFDEWNFQSLKDLLDVDIYIINDKNVITHSTFAADIGLDFSICCNKLVEILAERRNSGNFFADGLDIEQKTGEVKKYSYMATPDKKYIIELGYSLQDGDIFKEFNFLKVIDELIQKYPSVNNINVLNIGGFAFGSPVEDAKLSAEQRQAFEETLRTKQPTEIQNEGSINRYVHYVSEFDTGSTKNKVIEIVYNQNELHAALSNNKKTFIVQLSLILLVTVMLSLIISKWVSKPMYLAFHDSLTGLKNRAAFDELLKEKLTERTGFIGLVIIDLDNFKLINDYMGHDAGDGILKLVANRIQSSVRKEDTTIRLGGDEFVILMPAANRHEVEKVAERVIVAIKEATANLDYLQGTITASVGISLAPEHGAEPDILYKKADMALYQSKEKGKNQYHIYTD